MCEKGNKSLRKKPYGGGARFSPGEGKKTLFRPVGCGCSPRLCGQYKKTLFRPAGTFPLGKAERPSSALRAPSPWGRLKGIHPSRWEFVMGFPRGLLACRRQGARRAGENYRTLISLAALASFPLGKLQLSRAACVFQAANFRLDVGAKHPGESINHRPEHLLWMLRPYH